jgi:WD40 repeat protein
MDWVRQLLAIGGDNGRVELWDVQAEERLFELPGHDDLVLGVSFNSDGSFLVTTSLDGRAQIWDVDASLQQNEAQLAMSIEASTPADLTGGFLSDDNTRLAMNLGELVEVWDLANTSQPPVILDGHTNIVQYVAFHPNNRWLATAAADGTAKVWDSNTGEELFTLAGHKGFVRRLVFSPDGHQLISSGHDGTARIWNVESATRGEIVSFAIPETTRVWDLELSPDELKVALASENGPATVWDATTGEFLLALPGDSDTGVYSVSFHPDGTRIATVGEDGMARVWGVETGELLLEFTAHIGGDAGGYSGTMDVSYSPDGSRLATAGANGIAKVWDAETGEELLALEGHTAGLHSLVYSPDGRYIATGSDTMDSTVKVWDTTSGVELRSLGPNPGRAVGLAFSPDGDRLAAGGANGYLRIWDTQTGELVKEFTGQYSTIVTVLFSPDGQQLITGGIESANVWDIASGTEQSRLYEGAPNVALTKDGRRLYVADNSKPVVRVLTLSLEETIELAKSRVTRQLSDEECRQYLHLEACPD